MLQSSPTKRYATWIVHLGAMLLIACTYFVLRYPLRPLTLAYYDDGETLYHLLALLEGKVPYLENYNHHYIGYILPLALIAKVVGYTPDLLPLYLALLQTISGYLVFLILRSLQSTYATAFLGALLTVSAREPWVLGFYVQYALNPLWLLALFFALRSLQTSSRVSLSLSFATTGVAFTFDQRGIVFLFIPLCAVALRKIKLNTALLSDGVRSAIFWSVAPLFALGYLASHNALLSWYEQTYIFPSTYRVGGLTFGELLYQGLALHTDLFTFSPLLFICALLALIFIVKRYLRLAQYQLLLLSIVPLFLFAFFSGRDFDYYTVPWLPLLGLLAALLPSLIKEFLSAKIAPLAYALSASSIFIALLTSLSLLQDYELQSYQGDGAQECADFLRTHVKNEDSFYVLGYRLDLYARLGRTSSYPFGSQIFFIPDSKVSPEHYEAHTYSEYFLRFKETMQSTPPRWIVTFTTSELQGVTRPAEQYVQQMIASSYTERYSTKKKDFRGHDIGFIVWERTS